MLSIAPSNDKWLLSLSTDRTCSNLVSYRSRPAVSGWRLWFSSTSWFTDAPSSEDEVDLDITSAEQISPSEFSPVAQSPSTKPVEKDAEPSAKLKVGDRFPLLKIVEQRVTQQQPTGALTSTSRLSIELVLEVAEIVSPEGLAHTPLHRTAGDTKFNVEYQHVKFVQDLPGQEVDYDSDRPTGTVPPQVAAYQGLLGRSFSFWLNRDNQLQELIGFQEFLNACLQHVSPQERAIVWKSLAETTPTDQLANFVDDSIGLLPMQSATLGKSWRVERPIQHPVPVGRIMQYTIEDITPQTAEVAVGGTIVPLTEVDTGTIKLRVHGGRISGRCTIDRQTGLPRNCRVDQVLEMLVQLPGGESIPQTKQTITKFTALPGSVPVNNSVPYAGRDNGAVIR